MTGKRIKQVNNLIICFTAIHQYAVWTPDGRICLDDRMTLEQAEEYCKNTKDFLAHPSIVRWSSPWDGKEYFKKARSLNEANNFIQRKCRQNPHTALVFYTYVNREPVGRADYRTAWNCE